MFPDILICIIWGFFPVVISFQELVFWICILDMYSLIHTLFTAILEDLIKQGRIKGSISGGHQDKSVFYPDIYTRSQNQWVDSFYAQNGYLGKSKFKFVNVVCLTVVLFKFCCYVCDLFNSPELCLA